MRLYALFAASIVCVAPAAAAGSPKPTNSRVVVEARQFMRDYTQELLAGDRKALTARYSRRGAYTLGNWPKRFETHATIREAYASLEWEKPYSLSWKDLSFEPLGADAVVVVGNMFWGTTSKSASALIAYTAVLQRENGRLMIRVEHENAVHSTK